MSTMNPSTTSSTKPIRKNFTTGTPSVEIPLADLPEGAPKQVEHDGVKLVVIRSGERVFAYVDRCPHAYWPLSEGTVQNSVLECPGHGWEFDVQTGRCLNAPDHCLTAVGVVVEGHLVRFQESIAPPEEGQPEEGAR